MFKKRISSEGMNGNSYWYDGSLNPYFAAGYGLANCTCYSYGRAAEILGRKPEGLSLHNGKDWYNESVNFDKGQTPKLGAIVCFTGQYGHVAVVEEIHENGDIVCSNSNYGGDYFFMTYLTKESNYNNYDPSLEFEGFIYVYRGEDENGVTPQNECDQILSIGSTVRVDRIMTVSQVKNEENLIAINELTGEPTEDYHWFDPTPFDEVDANGNKIDDQILQPGSLVKLNGEFTVQELYKTEDWACKIQIGNRINWVWTEPCYEIKD